MKNHDRAGGQGERGGDETQEDAPWDLAQTPKFVYDPDAKVNAHTQVCARDIPWESVHPLSATATSDRHGQRVHSNHA